MKKPIRVDRDAREELRATARWYDKQRRGLGEVFLAAVDEAMQRVARRGSDSRPMFGVDPELAVRRVRTKRFPYAVVFLELPNTIRVIAIMHERRRPGYWLERVK